MISGGWGARLFLAHMGARIACKASQDSMWKCTSHSNQPLAMLDDQVMISMPDDLLYRTPTFHPSDQEKLTNKLQSASDSFEGPNNPWSSRGTGEIFAERNGSERDTAGIKNETWTVGVQPSKKYTPNDQLPARCIRVNDPEYPVESFEFHPGPGHKTGVSWASIPTDPICESPSRETGFWQYTRVLTNANVVPPNLAGEAFQKFPEEIKKAASHSHSPGLSHIGINILESSEQSILSGGTNTDFKLNHAKENSRKRKERLHPAHDSKIFSSAKPTPGIYTTGNNVVEGKSSSIINQRLDHNGPLEEMHTQSCMKKELHTEKKISQAVTPNKNQNKPTFSDIFKFDLKVFSKEIYQNEPDKLRAEAIITFINNDKTQIDEICLSKKEPWKIWEIIIGVCNSMVRKNRNSKNGIENKPMVPSLEEWRTSRNNKQLDSIHQLLSNREYWHLFWNDKSNVQISESEVTGNSQWLMFERTVNLFMFYIHMISTILGENYKFGNNSNQNILQQAYNFALDFAPESYLEAKSRSLSLNHEKYKQGRVSKIKNNQCKYNNNNKFQCTVSQTLLSSNWKWIVHFIKRSNNQNLMEIFFTDRFSVNVKKFPQDFFNNIFFYSIEKLNERLHRHYELEN